MADTRVAVVFGSDSDWPVMEKCVRKLQDFGLTPHVEVMSAHRTPARVAEFAEAARANGIQVIIAGAGLSAALPGVVAAHTTLPVIGVPLPGGDLQGLDALLAVAQMPPGVAVACVGIGTAGARNAALLAVQILAHGDEELQAALQKYRLDQAAAVAEKNRALQSKVKP